MPRVRADVLMVQRGLAETRERAQRLIMAGQARVGTTVLVKPATMLAEDAPLALKERERFVSRGGHKLQAALDAWEIRLGGRACVDVGASTGGFTDCMLQAGAASVLAVDVGRAQLHARLRDDPRVTLLEDTNAREMPELPSGISFFAVDVSFISLRKVLPSVAGRLPCRTEGVLAAEASVRSRSRRRTSWWRHPRPGRARANTARLRSLGRGLWMGTCGQRWSAPCRAAKETSNTSSTH